MQLTNTSLGLLGYTFTKGDVQVKQDLKTFSKVRGNKYRSRIREINKSIVKSTKVARVLGIVGVALTVREVGYDLVNGKDLTYGHVASVAIAGALALITFTNPVFIVGFAVYGIIDATGALDGAKSTLGVDNAVNTLFD